MQEEEVEGIALIGRTKKASKKRYKEKEGSGTGKKDLSKVMCFWFYKNPTVDRETDKSHLHRQKDPTFDYLIQLVLWG